MQIFKGIAFGLLFSVAGTIGYLLLGIVIGILRGPVITTGPAHATALSAVLGGLLEATVYNPFFWLGIVLAFGLAFWITGKLPEVPHSVASAGTQVVSTAAPVSESFFLSDCPLRTYLWKLRESYFYSFGFNSVLHF